MVTHGNSKRNNDFEYNKDAGMYVCKAGHMAIRKAKQGKKDKNQQVECYYFDVENVNVVRLKMDVIMLILKQKLIV